MNPTNISVFHAEYFPSIDWYSLWLQSEQAVIDQYEYFERKSNRNRCWVNGPNGKIMLSVPLDGGRNQKCRMKDLRIANHEKWAQVHWRTLDACYRRSPFFEFFELELNALFHTKFDFLLELNLATLAFLNKCLQVKKECLVSVAYVEDFQHDYRLNLPLQQSRIPYTQPFSDRHGFVPELSMLDALFCCGRASLKQQ